MQTRRIGALVLLTIAMSMTAPAHAGGNGSALSQEVADGAPPGAWTPAAGEAMALDSAAPPPRVEYKSYWLQILAIDAASIAVVIATGHPAPLLGNLLGSPIVHAAHGNRSSFFFSPVLRVGLPVAGSLAGAATANCRSNRSDFDFCGLEAAAVGFLVGAGAAMIIDYTLLANERIEIAPAEGLVIAPSVSASPGSLALGLSGRF